MGRGSLRRSPHAARAVYAAALQPCRLSSTLILALTHHRCRAQTRVRRACRRRSAGALSICNSRTFVSLPTPGGVAHSCSCLLQASARSRGSSGSGDDDRGALPFLHCNHHHKHHPHLVHYSYWRMCVCFGRATSTRAHAHSRMRQPDCPTPQPPHAKTDRLCFFAMPSTDAGRQHFAGTNGVLNPCIHLSS